jgi:hypothetical protein
VKKQGSHTAVTTTAMRPRRLRLVASAEERSLLERLTGNVDEQLALFAERMREGLLAASVAIGLEVMRELQEAEATELAGPKGKHDPEKGKHDPGAERLPARQRSRSGDVGWVHKFGSPANRRLRAIDLSFGTPHAPGRRTPSVPSGEYDQSEEVHHGRKILKNDSVGRVLGCWFRSPRWCWRRLHRR